MLFADDNLSIPTIQTLIFKEKRKRDNGKTRFVFMDISKGNDENLFFVEEEHFEDLVLDTSQLASKLDLLTK